MLQFVRDRARETLFFSPVLKVTNTFVLHVNGSCDVHSVCGERTTVLDVMMMYSKERYTENVLLKAMIVPYRFYLAVYTSMRNYEYSWASPWESYMLTL